MDLELILALVIGLNLILSGVSSLLKAFKVKLNEDHFFYKIMDLFEKVIDFLSANKKH